MTLLDSQPVDSAGDDRVGRPPAAALIRTALTQARVLAIRIIGHPGSGKTELIESTLKRMPAPMRIAVIVINPASSRDAQRLKPLCGYVGHIDAAVPDAVQVWRAMSDLQLDHFDTVLIEAAGGFAPLQDLGQDATVAVFSIGGGDDKAAKYHALINRSSAVLLTKIDLRPLIKFDEQVFRNDVRAINSAAEVFEVSSVLGAGMPDWINWLERTRAAKLQSRSRIGPTDWTPDKFIG
jgi:hydrogenase nickel incorporation protein HypB